MGEDFNRAWVEEHVEVVGGSYKLPPPPPPPSHSADSGNHFHCHILFYFVFVCFCLKQIANDFLG